MQASASGNLEILYNEIERLKNAQVTAATARDYRYAWSFFTRWCRTMELDPFPASDDTLALYVAHLLTTGKKVTTVTAYVGGVVFHHKTQGAPNPFTDRVRAIIAGAKQVRGSEQPRQMQPIGLAMLRQIGEYLGEQQSDVARRDLSLITLGWYTALRRSNLAWLRYEDLEFCGTLGLRVLVRREKNDRARVGRYIGVPFAKTPATCPVIALQRWLAVRGREAGPLYVRMDNGVTGLQPLSLNMVFTIVKRAATRVDPAGRWGSHSLRAGFITEAGAAGISHLLIQKQSGHKSLDQLARYFRPADVFRSNAASLLPDV